jgi:hypothetical protein
MAPTLTHSIYANDLVIFAHASKEEVLEINKILNAFGKESGL